MTNYCWTSVRRSSMISYSPNKFGRPAFICTLLSSISLLLYLYFCAKLFLSTNDNEDMSGADNHAGSWSSSSSSWNYSKSADAPSPMSSAPPPSSLQLEAVTAQSYNLHASNQKVFGCGSLTPRRPLRSEIRWNNYDWQNPENTGLFVYSAFYDRRMRVTFPRDGHSFVRILAMLDDDFQNRRHDHHYYCHIWLHDDDKSNNSSGRSSTMIMMANDNYVDDEPPIVVRAEMREIWHSEWDNDPSSSHHTSYKPYLLSCILPRKYDRLKSRSSRLHVSVSSEPCKTSNTYVAVQLHSAAEVQSSTNKKKKDFVVCVKPIDFTGDFSRKLIEWIELNAALGVDNIHIYRFRAHPNVDKVLNHYASQEEEDEAANFVEVTATTLAGNQPNYPLERSAFLKRNLWQKRRNELLPYNDCFYRHLYSHRYVIPIDLDEVIVPRRHHDLRQLFAYLEASDQYRTMLNTYASFSVRNAYFFESSKMDNEEQSSYFMKHTVRSANFSVGGKATKSVVRTDAALTVFNHYVLDALLPGVGRSHEIPVQLVQMNHYRASCPVDMSHECNNNFLKYTRRDTILWKYKTHLLHRIKLVTRILNL